MLNAIVTNKLRNQKVTFRQIDIFNYMETDYLTMIYKTMENVYCIQKTLYIFL